MEGAGSKYGPSFLSAVFLAPHIYGLFSLRVIASSKQLLLGRENASSSFTRKNERSRTFFQAFAFAFAVNY